MQTVKNQGHLHSNLSHVWMGRDSASGVGGYSSTLSVVVTDDPKEAKN